MYKSQAALIKRSSFVVGMIFCMISTGMEEKFFLTSVLTCDINIFRKMLRKVLGVMRINQEVFAPQEMRLIRFMS